MGRYFEQYLGIVEKNPAVANTAHARVYDMICSAGVEEVDGHKIYHFFDASLWDSRSLERPAEEYFHSAARRLDVRKRILLLMGPVSGGNSSLVTLLNAA